MIVVVRNGAVDHSASPIAKRSFMALAFHGAIFGGVAVFAKIIECITGCRILFGALTRSVAAADRVNRESPVYVRIAVIGIRVIWPAGADFEFRVLDQV